MKPKFAQSGHLIPLAVAADQIQQSILELAHFAGTEGKKRAKMKMEVMREPIEFLNREQYKFVDKLQTVYLPDNSHRKEAKKLLKICKSYIKMEEHFGNFAEALHKHPEMVNFNTFK